MSSRTQETHFPMDLDRVLFPSFSPPSARGPQPGGMHSTVSQGWVRFPRWGNYWNLLLRRRALPGTCNCLPHLNLADTAYELKNYCTGLAERSRAQASFLWKIKPVLSFTSPISPKGAGAVTSGNKKLGAFALPWQGPCSVGEMETV